MRTVVLTIIFVARSRSLQTHKKRLCRNRRVYEIRPSLTGAFRKRSIDELSLQFIDHPPADVVHQAIGLLHTPYVFILDPVGCKFRVE